MRPVPDYVFLAENLSRKDDVRNQTIGHSFAGPDKNLKEDCLNDMAHI